MKWQKNSQKTISIELLHKLLQNLLRIKKEIIYILKAKELYITCPFDGRIGRLS